MAGHRQLIVSADDFGMSQGVNAGVERAHRDGILTNASLMVNGAAVDEAVAIARNHPKLGVGLHLVLVQGRSALPASAIPALVSPEGFFSDNAILSGIRYFFQPGIRGQLRAEIREQLGRYRDTGLTLSHVDGHLNIHMHPAVLPILLELADEFGIRALRLSREALAPALRFDPQHRLRKAFEATAFGALAAAAEPRLKAASIHYPNAMFGLHQTGHVDERYLLQTIRDLPAGSTEIYCHAADNISQMDQLVLLNYPNQALGSRHDLLRVLQENSMPPGEPLDSQQLQALTSLAQRFAQLGDQALDYELMRAP